MVVRLATYPPLVEPRSRLQVVDDLEAEAPRRIVESMVDAADLPTQPRPVKITVRDMYARPGGHL